MQTKSAGVHWLGRWGEDVDHGGAQLDGCDHRTHLTVRTDPGNPIGVVGGDLLDRFSATDRLHDDQWH